MTQPLTTITRYGYDTQDNQTSVTDPNTNTTPYQYDDFGRKNQTISPDTGTTKYLYDEAGNLIQRTDARSTTVNYTYDALNRLTAIEFPADPNQNITFTYDSPSVTYGIGRLTGRVDPSGSYVFHYDAHGNLNKEEKTINSVLYTTQYTYNNNNILTSIIYPTGRTITYTPDQVGRVSQVSTTLGGNPKTLASSITYLPYGGITGLTYGNGLSLSQGYDNQYRISSILTGSIVNLTYGYDANGNIASVLDTVNPPGGEIFESPGTYTYQQGTNKLTHIEGTPSIDFGYDANANITSETGWTYIYDLSNQLVRVLSGSNQIAEYTYNGAGQRIKKVTQTETRIFHYDLSGRQIAETNQSGQMLAEYVYLGDQLLAMIKPGELAYYFHNDHLGTPQVLTNDSQTIAWKAAYTPFGEAVPSVETVENPFRFPGQYYDQETGLHYNYFRYYNPQTGRYITPDPIGLEGGINLFVYVQGNPGIKSDPLGLQESEFRPHPGFGDPPVSDDAPWGSAFPDPDSMVEGWRLGRESGYYKCYFKCLFLDGGVFASVIGKLFEEIITKGWLEHGGGEWIARHYYTKKWPKWFRAGGRYSKYWVPRLAGYVELGGKTASLLGWAVLYYEIYYKCIKKCEKCL
jgi:RHS repeat-associated protein